MINKKTQDSALEVRNLLLDSNIVHLYTENEKLTDNTVNVRGKRSVNFGSCSYLGLEFDERIIKGSSKALSQYGTQFSMSRAYMSSSLYKELEDNFRQIFGKPCIITPTTTLGHLSAVPSLIHSSDAVILDHQVHSSVQMAVQLIKPNGVTVQMIRHNRIDMLEDRIKKLKEKHDKIWYMADGIYSMYGDKAPLDEIYALMEKYPQLHLYIDDAHGMSCYGDKGQGYVLGHSELNERTVVAVSLAKAFASGGAVLVFPTEEMAKRVSICGIPMTTSGPIQPAVLGASIESSKLHLTSYISEIQTQLQENIKYTNILLNKFNLPLLHTNDSPIFFIGAGIPRVGRNLVNRLMNDGFYVNIGAYPAVPIKNTGIRFTITRLHTFEQIEALVESLAYHYPLALKKENMTMDQVCRNFNLPTENYLQDTEIESVMNYSKLNLEHCDSIRNIEKAEWDNIFKFNSQLNADQMEILEDAYSGNDLPEHNWDFDYIKVSDPEGKVILAAPLTTSLQKDDIFHPGDISAQIEMHRKKEDPYYLTSRVMMMGSPTSIGKAIYLDVDSPFIHEAIDKFTNKINKIQAERRAESVMLRDFNIMDESIKKRFEEAGYFKMETFKSFTLTNTSKTMEEHKSKLSKNSRRHMKRKSEKYMDLFDYEVVENPSQEQVSLWYGLYENVATQKTEINAFKLPFQLFSRLIASRFWEIHVLKTKVNAFDHEPKTVGVLFVHKSDNILTPNYIGLNYDFKEYNIYQQLMYRVVQYAIEQGYDKVDLGVTADFEKERVGAKGEQLFALVQVDDHYNHSHIEAVHNNKLIRN